MTALVVTTENEIRKVPYDAPHYEVIQEAVGGHYELVRPRGLQEPYCMMVNEEGRLLGLPLNLLGCYLYGTLIHGAPIAGDIMILKLGCYAGEPDVVGMTDEETQRLGDRFMQLSSGMVHWASDEERKPTS